MRQTLTDNELSVFSEQLAMILHSGISALEGVSILRDDAPEGEGKEILSAVYDSLEMSGDLAQALRESAVYPEYFVKMTEIGERSGTLEDVMAALADYYGRQDALMRSIRDALTYPLILLGMLFAVLIVLITQVMPVFREVFDQLGIEMTGISAAVFRASSVLQGASVFVLALVVIAALGCLIALRSKKGRDTVLGLTMHIPLGKKINTLLACSRFCDALGLALHSGLDMGESFQLAAGLTDKTCLKDNIDKAGKMLEEGSDLAESMRDAGIITGLNARMVAIGFRTGSAETVMKRISVSCQEEADNSIQSAVNALEPTLTAVLSVLTGLILVSVMLPLLGVMANIG